ncbi:MAG: YcjF family protein [Microcoleaceae cyanobacterium]
MEPHYNISMAVKLQRPILVGGVGLSFLLWILSSLQHSAGEFGQVALLSTILVSAGLWWFQTGSGQSLQEQQFVPPASRETVEAAIVQTEAQIDHLAQTAADLGSQSLAPSIELWRSQTAQLKTNLDRTSLRLGVMGSKAVGKSTVMQVLASDWIPQQALALSLVEVPTSQPQLTTAVDVVLFLTSGDITDPEFQTLSQLVKGQGQRTLLVWNKLDQYLEGDQPIVLQHIRETLTAVLQPEDVIAIAASPSAMKVRQHQADGSVQEWMEDQFPEMQALTERLSQVLQQEQQALVWSTTYREAIAQQKIVRTGLNQLWREQALPVIDQYQWIAAAAAFANPVPALDVLATAAISSQMVIDLGTIYKQKFSLQQAQEIAKTLASQMLKLGLVELTTQTLTSLLKSNTVTFVAGGAVQAISAAYLTQIAGLSLVEYFESQEINLQTGQGFSLDFNALTQTLKAVFQQNQKTSILQSFVQQALNRLSPQIQLPSSSPIA